MRGFSELHPAVQLAWLLSVAAVTMFTSSPVLSAAALLGGLACCLVLRPRVVTLREIGVWGVLFLLVTLTNPLFSQNGETVLVAPLGRPITAEALAYGAAAGGMLIGVLAWCKCLSAVLTGDRLLYLFGRAVPRLSLVLSMTMHFLPVLRRQMKQVEETQRTMGLYAAEGRLARIKSHGRVLVAMLSRSLEDAMDTAASMRARGYGTARRTSLSLFHMTAGDALLLSVVLICLAVVLVGAALGAVTFTYYPHFGRIGTSPLAWAVYLAFGVLSFGPAALEAKEGVLWSFYRSRI